MKQKWQNVDMMGDGYLGVYYPVFSNIVYVFIFPE